MSFLELSGCIIKNKKNYGHTFISSQRYLLHVYPFPFSYTSHLMNYKFSIGLISEVSGDYFTK